jgi:pantothenate kinase-related protein Tda10
VSSGSVKLKSVPADYEGLLAQVQKELGPNRRPLLIAIDGPDGVGKSSLASWLAWQLEMPSLHTSFVTASHSNGELTI